MPRLPAQDAAGLTLAEYPRPSVAVDTAVLSVPPDAADLHVLLVRRPGSARSGWALPGTFLHEGETLSQAVLRSLRDKVGVEGLDPRQLCVLDALDRDDWGRVLSVAHVDVVRWDRLGDVMGHDVRSVPVPEATGLAYDHDRIVRLAVAQVRETYAGQPDPDRLLQPPFTLLELRRLHEAVMGRPLPRDSFRRLMQPQLQPTRGQRAGVVGKPAQLFTHRRGARR